MYSSPKEFIGTLIIVEGFFVVVVCLFIFNSEILYQNFILERNQISCIC